MSDAVGIKKQLSAAHGGQGAKLKRGGGPDFCWDAREVNRTPSRTPCPIGAKLGAARSASKPEPVTARHKAPAPSQWRISASDGALKTSNPIREIIETMNLAQNPAKKVIPLSIGDPTIFGNLKPCNEILDSIQRANASGKFYGYQTAAGMEGAREAVAEYFHKCTGSRVKLQDVILASGCSHAIDLCICVLAQRGQNILIPRPGFPLYKTLTAVYGVHYKQYDLLADKNWIVDLKHLESLIDENTAAIVVNNPSNPCGSVFSKRHLRQILRLAERYRLPIIADEIYDKFVFSPSLPEGAAEAAPAEVGVCFGGGGGGGGGGQTADSDQPMTIATATTVPTSTPANKRQLGKITTTATNNDQDPITQKQPPAAAGPVQSRGTDYISAHPAVRMIPSPDETIYSSDSDLESSVQRQDGVFRNRSNGSYRQCLSDTDSEDGDDDEDEEDQELESSGDENDYDYDDHARGKENNNTDGDGRNADQFKYVPFRSMSSLSDTVPILTCGGISKTCLIPGLRLGWIIINDPKNIFDASVRQGLGRLTQRLMGPNSLVQGALPDILRSVPESFYKRTMDFIFENAKLCYRRLLVVKGLQPYMPRGSMYLMVRFNPQQFPKINGDLDFTSKLMNEESVLVLPGKCFDFPNFFRVCLTVPTSVMEEAMNRIQGFCERHAVVSVELEGKLSHQQQQIQLKQTSHSSALMPSSESNQQS